MIAEFMPILFTVLTATGTAIVAGIVSFVAGRGMKNHEWRLELTKERLMAREQLYADFLALVSDHAPRSMDTKFVSSAAFSEVMQKNERIALVASAPVVEATKAICAVVISANGVEKNNAFDGFFDLKQTFFLEVRRELASLER